MRGGGSAKGRADAAARYARWWVGHSGALPERASGVALNAVDGCELFELDQNQRGALYPRRRSPDEYFTILDPARRATVFGSDAMRCG